MIRALLGPLGHQLVEVVGLGGGELTHGEVVEDQDVGPGPGLEAGLPAPIGMAAGQVADQAGGLGERTAVAVAAGGMAERLGDHGLAHPDGPVEDDRLGRLDEAQCGQVADLGGRDLGVVGEVELLDGRRRTRSGPRAPGA